MKNWLMRGVPGMQVQAAEQPIELVHGPAANNDGVMKSPSERITERTPYGISVGSGAPERTRPRDAKPPLTPAF